MNPKIEKRAPTREAQLLHAVGQLQSELKAKQLKLVAALIAILLLCALPMRRVLKTHKLLTEALRSDPMRAEMEDKNDSIHYSLARQRSGVLEARDLSVRWKPLSTRHRRSEISLSSYPDLCDLTVRGASRSGKVTVGLRSAELSFRPENGGGKSLKVDLGAMETSIEMGGFGENLEAQLVSRECWRKGEIMPHTGSVALTLRGLGSPGSGNYSLQLNGQGEGALQLDSESGIERLVFIPK